MSKGRGEVMGEVGRMECGEKGLLVKVGVESVEVGMGEEWGNGEKVGE